MSTERPLLCLGTVALLAFVSADPCLGRGGAVLEEFRIPACGGLITVPVTCSGESFQFLLDTGAGRCLVDKSLAALLGESVGRTYAQTPGGVEAIELYLPLRARVGKLRLDPDEPVACVDLSSLERATGEPIRGIIGMSFMRRYGLQLDFDEGAVRFLETPLPPDGDYGYELELGLEPYGAPELTTPVVDTTEWTFIVDTGCQFTGSMDHRMCERLLAAGVLHPVGLTRGAALVRDFTASLAALDSLALGPFTHRNLMLSRTESSVLGIPFLRQYKATFDFPERRVWLEPSSRHAAPPCFDFSGLGLAMLGGECVVTGTTPGRAASLAGLEQGDVLVSVGATSVYDGSLACVREDLCTSMGDTLLVVASRQGEEFSTVLDLRWRAVHDTVKPTMGPPD